MRISIENEKVFRELLSIKNRPTKQDSAFKFTKNQKEKAAKLRMLQIVEENLKLARRLIYAWFNKSSCTTKRPTIETDGCIATKV